MDDERQEFSLRLVDAMRKAGYEPRPGVLHKVFNSHYDGTSVSEMTASRWLNGNAMPGQDKLRVLADLFGIEPHVLQFGKARKGRIAESKAVWPAGIGARERQVIDAFLSLPLKRRELVGELILALVQSAG